MLNAKRTSATAASGSIRIVELEAGSVQTIDVIDFGSIHIQQAGLVDKNLQTFEFKNGIALIVESLVEAHAIGETGAAASHDLDSQARIRLGLIRQNLSNFLFCFLCQSYRHDFSSLNVPLRIGRHPSPAAGRCVPEARPTPP